MKNLLIILLSLFVFISCRGLKIQSTWLDNKISIDGTIEDWKDMPRIYEEDIKIMYSVANDYNHLNLMYCFNDPALARMIAMRGVTVWFNDEAKKEKNFGIAFKNDLMDQRKDMNREQIHNQNEQLSSAKDLRELLKSGRFTVELKDTLSGLLLDETLGVEASMDQIEGLYCFEMKLPLSEIKKSKTVLQIPEDNQMKIAIEIPEAKRFTIKRKGDSMGGGRGGMRGGGKGGRGGSPPGGEKNRLDMSAKEIWSIIVLAEKPN